MTSLFWSVLHRFTVGAGVFVRAVIFLQRDHQIVLLLSARQGVDQTTLSNETRDKSNEYTQSMSLSAVVTPRIVRCGSHIATAVPSSAIISTTLFGDQTPKAVTV